MNPYSVTNPLNPAYHAHHPAVDSRQTEAAFEPVLSRAAYRLVSKVDQILFNRGR
jgi:hypothetical protein